MMPYLVTDSMARWRPRLRIGGIAALALSVVIAAIWPQPLFRGYLAAFIFWLQFPLGAGALLLMHALTSGRWGFPIRGALAAMLPTLPLAAVLFLPIAGGVSQLYEWARHGVEGAHGGRALYLSLPFFLGRTGFYLAIWLVGAWLLGRRLNMTAEREFGGALGALGLLAYFLTVTFAAIDWIGSLHAHWYSSILGLYVIIGQAIAALALAIVLSLGGEREESTAPLASKDRRQEIATLLLALVALHAYFAFSQYFIIWNGNLPHEIEWYLPRMRGVWGAMAAALMLLHFGLPFALLLFRAGKRSRRTLRFIAGLLLAMRAVEAAWMVIPSRAEGQFVALVAALVTGAGMGCAWLLVFSRRWPRIVEGAPRTMEAA